MPRARSKQEPRARPGWRELALALGSGLFLWLVLELAVRGFDPQPVSRYRYAPESFYAPDPGVDFVYRRREFAIPVHYNSHGMRDREREIRRPAGGLRVALIGDSQAESKEVPFDSTLAQILERGLAARFPGRPVEVLNFGVSGFGTIATLGRYTALGRQFAPDLVLYLFMENDFEDNLGSDRRLYEIESGALRLERLPDNGWVRTTRAGLDIVKHHSQCYSFLKFRLAELRARARNASMPGVAHASTAEEAWDVLELALAALHREVQAGGAELLFVQGGTRGPEVSARLAHICAGLGTGYFDLLPTLATYGNGVFFQYDGHWRCIGHRLAGAALLPVVAEALGAAAGDTTSLNGTGSRSDR